MINLYGLKYSMMVVARKKEKTRKTYVIFRSRGLTKFLLNMQSVDIDKVF